MAQRVFLFYVLTSLNCHRFNCHSQCVSGIWRLMSERMNFSFWQVRQHLKHGAHSTAVSRQHVHKIHIANNSATGTTSSSALNKNIHTSAALFSKDDKCKLPPDSPTFFWTLWWFIGEKQKVIWCVRWEECCGRSDMGTGVRPVLFNGRRHFWLKAACWEPPLRTCANLETAHTHINPFLIRYTHRQQQHVWAVYMQQVKACERGRAERQREKQKKRTLTQCCSALWEELLLRLF